MTIITIREKEKEIHIDGETRAEIITTKGVEVRGVCAMQWPSEQGESPIAIQGWTWELQPE